MATQRSVIFIESKNSLKFNEFEDKIASCFDKSAFYEFSLLNKYKEIYDLTCAAIDDSVYSPLCNSFMSAGCNRPTVHNYSQLYFRLIKEGKNIKEFCEIGIGTNNQDVPSAMNSDYSPGASLRGWCQFFSDDDFVIHGGDVDPRVIFQDKKIHTSYINQLNPDSIYKFIRDHKFNLNGIDFFLDDALHEYRSNLTLLLCVWPYMRTGGLYVIEDMIRSTYSQLLNFLVTLNLNADIAGYELPSNNKDDNRVIVLQKCV